jgi:hypothetical protein
MTASERAFKQVKSILGKLDRSIAEARAKRLNRRPDEETPRASAAIGRAQPLRRDRPADSLQRWGR